MQPGLQNPRFPAKGGMPLGIAGASQECQDGSSFHSHPARPASPPPDLRWRAVDQGNCSPGAPGRSGSWLRPLERPLRIGGRTCPANSPHLAFPRERRPAPPASGRNSPETSGSPPAAPPLLPPRRPGLARSLGPASKRPARAPIGARSLGALTESETQ